jgi:hypothetical protein
MEQYVCARITRMDDADLGLFDYDRNNTLFFFLLNADEQIYMRYGGRDAQSPDTYLNLNSLELALAQGLELHRRYQAGDLPRTPRPKPLFAREFPLLVERTIARNACVECHLIGDFQNIHREQDGTLDKLTHMYRSPDIRTIGIQLDIPKGLVVREAAGESAAAGMKAGDRIAEFNGAPVWTFADLQYRYDQTPRAATSVTIGVERQGKTEQLAVQLPLRWWLTDIRYRQLSVDPRVYFDSRPLAAAEKSRLGLDPEGFASEVTRVDSFAELMKVHELKTGDIIVAVDGVGRDPVAHTAELYIKLRKTAGDPVEVDLIRAGERMRMPVKTLRMSFRK